MPRRLLALVAIVALSASHAEAMQCTVCHSKNPAMVKMHKATNEMEISCFDCHRIGEKLMGKGAPKDRESQLKRRATDPICARCHLNR